MSQKRKLLIIIFLIILGIAVNYFWQFQKEGQVPDGGVEGETDAQRQIRELDAIRQQRGLAPLAKEQVEQQIKELNALRGNQPPLSKEEIQKQIDELNKIYNQKTEK